MRYLALACDYDGTLATDGQIDDLTIEALQRVRDSGRKLLLVTGRELPELQATCPRLDLFDWVVAENGALLFRPSDGLEKPLGDPPPEKFIEMLRSRGVAPLSVGRSIVATWQPHENAVLESIRDCALEMQVIFNKGAVMVLPSGVNKASGLAVALAEMKFSPHNVVAVGDAENDHAFLGACECGAAVGNALPMLKERADVVLDGARGAGVRQLIDLLLENDLADLDGRLQRHRLLLGHVKDQELTDQELTISPYPTSLLIAGTSGGGKSTLASSIHERLKEHGYQFCVIDPEGDHGDLPDTVHLGDAEHPLNVEAVIKLLENPADNAVVNLVSAPLQDRPTLFLTLLAHLLELRTRLGHPHWIVVDEAHHVLPAALEPSMLSLPQDLDRVLMITLEPSSLASAALKAVDIVLAVGDDPRATLQDFAQAAGQSLPKTGPVELKRGEALVWRLRESGPPVRMQSIPSKLERRRHNRKYMAGDLGPDRSFYFRGPEGKLNLRSQNLLVFLQMAEGVDEEAWLFHLRGGHYSQWFRTGIKDDALADDAEEIETAPDISAAESRAQIKSLIEQNYTLPASASPLGAQPTAAVADN